MQISELAACPSSQPSSSSVRGKKNTKNNTNELDYTTVLSSLHIWVRCLSVQYQGSNLHTVQKNTFGKFKPDNTNFKKKRFLRVH